MIGFANGTTLVNTLKGGGPAKVLDVRRFDFTANIDEFVKKDLKKMLNEMEIFSNTMRESKDDFKDPRILLMKANREAFRDAVMAKDYGAIRTTFQKWIDDLDILGQWEITETY